jgi:hypothetical protein
MSADYQIRVDLSEMLAGLGGVINAYVLPTVHQAVKAVASEAAYRWKDGVAKAKLWNGEKQAYIESINWLMLSDFEAIVSTTYDQAGAIETGRPAYDMKKRLNTSMKVRVAKHGKHAGMRYLIIPMRHNTPGNVALAQAMPDDIYKKAKRLDPSIITGTVSRPSGTGAISLKTKKPVMVPQQQYSWGGKLPAGLAPKLKPHHTTDIYAGMYRFNTSAGKGKSSSYNTFRVMGEWQSDKWIIPAKPGLYLAKSVQDSIALDAPKVFEQAIAHLK